MTEKQKEFVLNMDKHCQDHDDWLVLVRFGMPTLIKDQEVLIELIHREARRETTRDVESDQHVFSPSEYVMRLMDELSLRFVVAAPRGRLGGVQRKG